MKLELDYRRRFGSLFARYLEEVSISEVINILNQQERCLPKYIATNGDVVLALMDNNTNEIPELFYVVYDIKNTLRYIPSELSGVKIGEFDAVFKILKNEKGIIQLIIPIDSELTSVVGMNMDTFTINTQMTQGDKDKIFRGMTTIVRQLPLFINNDNTEEFIFAELLTNGTVELTSNRIHGLSISKVKVVSYSDGELKCSVRGINIITK